MTINEWPSLNAAANKQTDIVCHAPGHKCLGCDHYEGKADRCEYETAQNNDLTSVIRARDHLAEMYQDSERRLSSALDALHRISELSELAIASDGYEGWKIVNAEGFEAQTFFDVDDIKRILERFRVESRANL